MRLGYKQVVAIVGELLRQYSDDESAVVAKSGAVLCRSFCIESYSHFSVVLTIITRQSYIKKAILQNKWVIICKLHRF